MDYVSLTLAIEQLTWKIQGLLQAKGYVRMKIEHRTYQHGPNLIHVATETDSGFRAEFFFPLPLNVNLIVTFFELLPYPPVEVFSIESNIMIEGETR